MALECCCLRPLPLLVKQSRCLRKPKNSVGLFYYFQPSQQINAQLKKMTPPLYWPFKKSSLFKCQNFYYLGKMGLKYQSNNNRNFVREVKRHETVKVVRGQDVIKGMRRVIQDKKMNLHQTGERWRRNSKRIMADIRETKSKMREKMEEVIERENVYTVPNLLCLSRIAMSPFLGYLILEQDFHWALGVLTVAGITDLLDGWIARTFKNQSSKLGSFLDPMADKVLMATMFLTLTYVAIIPVALTGLIITRDALLVGAGFVIRYKSLPPPRTLSRYFDATHATAQLAPTFISKVNTTVQLFTAACTLAAPVFNYMDHPALQALWWVTAGTTVASAGSYLLSKNTFKFNKKK